jgi:SHS2 domain-containing protein
LFFAGRVGIFSGMTRSYSILDHPSDQGIEARGANITEAFEEAARGLISVIADPSTIRAVETIEIHLTADDEEQLLVRWLSEILYLYDGKHFLGKEFNIRSVSPKELRATVMGEDFSTPRHVTRMDVKAITYHQINITKTAGSTILRVFLDI